MSRILITGGAGFIGSNAANRFAKNGDEVVIYDNYSRPNVKKNIQWLKEVHPNIQFVEADIKDSKNLEKHIPGCDIVFHLAGQVAVTSSVLDPMEDFETNVRGTLNVLETIRNFSPETALVYSSSNKVYGEPEQIQLTEESEKYDFAEPDHHDGINESQPLDFRSPYGCSKGAAGQYIRDYSRIYGLKTVVLRQSCIYGRRQFGTEDQGWLFHFLKMGIQEEQITIFGNGKQVRDVLYIDDLIDLYELVSKNIDKVSGEIFNVGGGRDNSLSLLQSLDLIKEIICKELKIKFDKMRPGDQKIYISNNNKLFQTLNWSPKIGYKEGLTKLYAWLHEIIS